MKLWLNGSSSILFTIYLINSMSLSYLISLCSRILEPSSISLRGTYSALSEMDFILTFILSIEVSTSVNLKFTCCKRSLFMVAYFILLTLSLSSILGKNPLSRIPIAYFIYLIYYSMFFTKLSITSILLTIFSLGELF